MCLRQRGRRADEGRARRLVQGPARGVRKPGGFHAGVGHEPSRLELLPGRQEVRHALGGTARQREGQEPGARVHSGRSPRPVAARRVRRVRSLGDGGGDVPGRRERGSRESKSNRRRKRAVAASHRRAGARGGHLVRRARAPKAEPRGELLELALAQVRVLALRQAPLDDVESVRRLTHVHGREVNPERDELPDRGDDVPEGAHAVTRLVFLVSSPPVRDAVEHSLGAGDAGVVGRRRREQMFARNLRDNTLGDARGERGRQPVRGAARQVARGMTPELGRGGAEAAHQPSEGSEGSARAVRHRALDVPGSGILNGRAQRPDRPTGDRARNGTGDGHELARGGSRHHPHGRAHANVRIAQTAAAAAAAEEVLQRAPGGDAPLRAATDAKLRAEELGGGVLARKVRTESAVGRRESREVGPKLTRPRTSAVRKFSPGCLAHGSRGDALDKVSRRDRILRGGGNLTGRRHDAPGGHHAARGHVSYGRTSPRLVRSLRRESLEHGAE